MDQKRCSACKNWFPVDDFVRRTDRPQAWYSECRGCTNARRREDYVAKLGRPRARAVEATAPPGPKGSDEARRQRLSREREREVVTLIRRYAAVRFEPGRDRDAAYNALALALRDHHIPVSDGERQWEWNKGLGEITSRLLRRVWRAPEDRHADPRRVARGDAEYRLDLDYDRIDTLA